MISDNLRPFYSVIPAKAGIQLIDKTPRSGTTTILWLCPLARRYMMIWIPAFAGMTASEEVCNELRKDQ